MSNDFPYELNERMRQNAGERPPELGQALTSVRRSQQGRTHIQNRYTPSLKRPLSKVYRPWFFVVALCALLIGIAIIVCSSIMKDTDNDVADHIFHLWVGIPLIFVALLGVTVSAMKDRKVVVLFLVVTLIVMVICGCAALISGMRFWRDGWQATRTQLNRSGKCKDVNNQCTCTGILTLPSKDCRTTSVPPSYLSTEILPTSK